MLLKFLILPQGPSFSSKDEVWKHDKPSKQDPKTKAVNLKHEHFKDKAGFDAENNFAYTHDEKINLKDVNIERVIESKPLDYVKSFKEERSSRSSSKLCRENTFFFIEFDGREFRQYFIVEEFVLDVTHKMFLLNNISIRINLYQLIETCERLENRDYFYDFLNQSSVQKWKHSHIPDKFNEFYVATEKNYVVVLLDQCNNFSFME